MEKFNHKHISYTIIFKTNNHLITGHLHKHSVVISILYYQITEVYVKRAHENKSSAGMHVLDCVHFKHIYIKLQLGKNSNKNKCKEL